MSLFSLTNISYNNAINSPQTYNAELNSELPPNFFKALGLGTSFFGICCIFQGILHAYNIPSTHHETLMLSLRSTMNSDDYRKHEIGNTITSSIEIIIGVLFMVAGIITTNAANTIASSLQKNL